MREGGRKLTKIYHKSEHSFHVAYDLNFHFPKKVNFFILRKFLYGLYRRRYFLGILGFVLKNEGKITWWVKRMSCFSPVSVSDVFFPWYIISGDFRERLNFNFPGNFQISEFPQEKIGNFSKN